MMGQTFSHFVYHYFELVRDILLHVVLILLELSLSSLFVHLLHSAQQFRLYS